jgi:exopolysaccharide production protein ExoZ
MFFYALFAVALLVVVRYRLLVLIAALLAFTIGGLFVESTDSPELWVITRPYLLEFVLGVLIAEVALRHRPRLSRAACALMVVGGFAVLLSGLLNGEPQIPGNWISWTGAVVSASSIVAGAVMYELQYSIRYWRWLILLGNASYAIYLTHWFVLKIATVYVLKNPVLLPICAISLCLATAVAVYLFVEKPIQKAIRACIAAQLTTSPGVR